MQELVKLGDAMSRIETKMMYIGGTMTEENMGLSYIMQDLINDIIAAKAIIAGLSRPHSE